MTPSTVTELYQAWEIDFEGYPLHGIVVADRPRKIYGIRIVSSKAAELIVSGLKEPIVVSPRDSVFLWETQRKSYRS